MTKSTINSSEAKEVASDYLLTTGSLRRSQPQDVPTIILVAAQPGAGKTGLGELTKESLRERGGYVRVDADRLRERLPYYPELAREDPLNAAARSQADAGLCVQELRQLAIAQRRNIIEEGTFRSPEGTEYFVDALKQRGYRVELRVLAVPPEQSRLGIYERYEQQLVGGIVPRNVPDAYHDEAVAGLNKSIARVAGKVDRVSVHNRAGEVLFDSMKEKGSPMPAIEQAQQNATPAQTAYAAAEWSWINERASQRNEQGARRDAIERHLVDAHEKLRADPAASRIYDKHASPSANEFSKILATYAGSVADKLRQATGSLRARGVSAASTEKVMAGVKERLGEQVKRGERER
jgi:predicted ABC-type ATPase